VALRLAHRGDWRRSPENSLAAFQAALAVPGCDGLEFDVRISRDDTAVCYHDDTMKRLHGIDRRVADLTADELETAGVPTLQAVLEQIPRRAFLDIELKVVPTRATFETLVGGRGPGLERAVVSSFDPVALRRMAGWAPTWALWLNTTQTDPATIELATDLGCRGMSIEWHALDAGSVARCRDAGLEVAGWTVRRRPTLQRLDRLGVTAVCVEGAALDG
jgi:glycerophosphoryl diester phosphodiesterase